MTLNWWPSFCLSLGQKWRKPDASVSGSTSLGRWTPSGPGRLGSSSPSVTITDTMRPSSATAARDTAGVWTATAGRCRGPGRGPAWGRRVSRRAALGSAGDPCLGHSWRSLPALNPDLLHWLEACPLPSSLPSAAPLSISLSLTPLHHLSPHFPLPPLPLFFSFLVQTCLVQMMGRACWIRLRLIAESVCVLGAPAGKRCPGQPGLAVALCWDMAGMGETHQSPSSAPCHSGMELFCHTGLLKGCAWTFRSSIHL